MVVSDTGSTEPLPAPRRVPDHRAGAWARLAALSGAFTLAYALANWISLPAVPLCGFKRLLGLPCPGCGMTRAVIHLADADLVTSFYYHPLGVFLGAAALAALVGALIGIVRGRDPAWELLERRGALLVIALVGGLLVVWVARTFVLPDLAPADL